jgi:phosphoenolpyruvate phosphomutase
MRLREGLLSPDILFLMEAHNGFSAKVVERAGFKAIWASGLTMSASLGLRDNNEASWTQVLDIVEHMVDSVAIPVLIDGDTGYGNFNNARRLVRKLEQRGAAGVCIEDKLFPKTNSFVGEGQPLAEIGEFCGKIKAAKDSQSDSDFVVVARVEALIAGYPVYHALERASAYADAGADAILIHSKKSDAIEILQFSSQWRGHRPLLIVPTMYHSTPTKAFENTGISGIIWANQLLRSSLRAMETTAGRIASDRSLHNVELDIASVGDLFDIVNNRELEEAEHRYLPATPYDVDARD